MSLFDMFNPKKDKNLMTKEEFIKKIKEDEEYAPGWMAIDEELERLYKDQTPTHYATPLASRAIVGGNEYLDGFSIYDSKNDYKHIVTYGMTELYANEDAFAGEFSKWGYEMTIKLAEEKTEDCLWALNMLGNLARYTYTRKRFFEPFQFIRGNGGSLNMDRDSKVTSIFLVKDTELNTLDTVYGKTDFIQLVGITESDLEKLIENPDNAKKLYDLMKADNPNFVTDLNSEKSYL